MPTYDYVIAGGGLAGLSLACQMVRSPLCGASLLIVDRPLAAHHDRLWSYWTHAPTLFDPIVAHAWPRLRVNGPDGERAFDLPGCRYELLRGADLRCFARQELAQHAHVHFCDGVVERIEAGPRGARLQVDGQMIEAQWVFDSTGWPPPRHTGPWRMFFQGWTLRAPRPVFDPSAVTFLDTRTPQHGELRFFYVLPYSEREALVEYVAYARTPPSEAAAQAALAHYLGASLGLSQYAVLSQEAGVLPIVPTHGPRRVGPRHVAIGARAGLIKPSTGFGLQRIQQDSAAIVQALVQADPPWRIPSVSGRHRLYDALLLEVLAHDGPTLETVFAALFARNPLERVLRFLDEATTPAEDVQLIATLPPQPFLRVLPRLLLKRLAGTA